MKLIFYIFVLLASCAKIRSWQALEITDDSKDHPGHCFSVDPKVGAMKKNESRQLENCVEATCRTDKVIEYVGCGVISVEGSCKIVDCDKSKPYPDCCPTITC